MASTPDIGSSVVTSIDTAPIHQEPPLHKPSDTPAALATGGEFGCTCGQPECPTPLIARPPNNAVVYLLADHHPTNNGGGPGGGPDGPDSGGGPDPGGGPDSSGGPDSGDRTGTSDDHADDAAGEDSAGAPGTDSADADDDAEDAAMSESDCGAEESDSADDSAVAGADTAPAAESADADGGSSDAADAPVDAAAADQDSHADDTTAPAAAADPAGGESATAEGSAVSNAAERESTADRGRAGSAGASSARYRLAAPRCGSPPGYLFGAGVLTSALAAALMDGAQVRQVAHPGPDSVAEPRYGPSRRLADFVRCRDVTCRFPGCDQPATGCDIDHTVPYPAGPTHPSNLKCLCRFHHMLKTFWGGRRGWRDKQLPDGTIIWTSPTGHTYVTHPGSRQLYPQLCAPTATLWHGEPPVIEAHPLRGLKMPKRRRTRAQDRAARIHAERKLNNPRITERNKPPPF
ncbi:HNH endonuclease signature motif containing protein [Mycolicibacterium agri]|nr:HNH endonuclease signature motif containing protein [Mycolicibacterium agri]